MRQKLFLLTRRSLIPKNATSIRRIHINRVGVPAIPEQPLSPFKQYLAQINRDHKIDTRWVRVKDGRGVSDPTSLQDLLSQVDRSKETVVQISKPGTQQEAIVEILSFEQLRARFHAKANLTKSQDKSQKESKAKQVELNWAIGDHDLALKLKQLEQFLNKGRKVEIVLAPKRQGRRATTEEAQKLLDKIRDKIVEADSKEIAPLDGTILRTAIMKVKKREQG